MTTRSNLDPDEAPDPPAEIHSNWGPRDGPIRWRDHCLVMSIYARPSDGSALGIDYPIGFIADPTGSIETFRLVIGKAELEERFFCLRRLVKLGTRPNSAAGNWLEHLSRRPLTRL